jgi:hypothetical protein
MSEKTNSNLSVNDVATIVNSGALMYLYRKTSVNSEDIKKDESFSHIIRRNLNLLNMKFKSSLMESALNNRARQNEIDEMREIIMSLGERVDTLEQNARVKTKEILIEEAIINPLLTQNISASTTPEISYSAVSTGDKTTNLYG